MSARASLSACLIVKNEAARLPRCLASLRGVVDEIVVVDTGSTDESVAVAKRFGAKVSQFAWCDDFASARNVAIERASSEWVLTIDADEWVKAGSAAALTGALNDRSVVAYRVKLINHLDGDRRDEELLTRLFRRRADIRYRGRVHEQVTDDVVTVVEREGLGWGTAAGLVLEHDGYLRAIMKERQKGARNLRLLERAVEESPRDEYLRYKLAIELGPRGTAHLERVLEQLTQKTPRELLSLPWAEQALINGALVLSVAGRSTLVEQVTALSSAVFGDHPALDLSRARVELKQGHAERALELVRRAEHQRPRGPGYDGEALSLELELVAAEALSSLEDYEGALSTLSLARRAHPGSARPLYALIELCLTIGDVKGALRLGLSRLKECPSDTTALSLCAQVAERAGDLDTARRWRAALG